MVTSYCGCNFKYYSLVEKGSLNISKKKIFINRLTEKQLKVFDKNNKSPITKDKKIMAYNLNNKLVVAVSSRALFDLETKSLKKKG